MENNDIKKEFKELKASIKKLIKEQGKMPEKTIRHGINTVIFAMIIIGVAKVLFAYLSSIPPRVVPHVSSFDRFLKENIKVDYPGRSIEIFYLGAQEIGEKFEQFIKDTYPEHYKQYLTFKFAGNESFPAKIDTALEAEIAQRYSITDFPALIIFKAHSNDPAYIIMKKDLQGLEKAFKNIIENNFGDTKRRLYDSPAAVSRQISS
jgi:hypothetical protein